MAKRPEGLSPNFDSIISPQITSSLIFSWTFIKETALDFQKAAEVKIYGGSDVALITLAAGTSEEIDLSANLSALELGQFYEWEVKVTASNNTTALSGRKRFRYSLVEGQSELNWPVGPDAYEYIGTRQYFNEIRENAISVLQDYVEDTLFEMNAMDIAENLFTGDVVPSRKDFDSIEVILNLIAEKESTYREDVVRLIEDGLGAEDLHKIYKLFNRLVDVAPQPPSNIYLSFDGLVPLEMTSGSAINKGVGDLSIDVRWFSSELEAGTCSINFMNDLTEDVAYYGINLEAGFSDYRVNYQLYFRTEDIVIAGNRIDLPMDHINFEHLSTSKNTVYVLKAVATDKRGRESSPHSQLSNVNDVPLGVSKYQLRAARKDLLNKVVLKTYYDIYNGPLKAYVHNVSGVVDGIYQYAVRLYDKNGNNSPFLYIDDYIKVDPLSPPAAPKVTVKSVTTSTITFSWPAVKDADSYEVDPQWGTTANKIIDETTHQITVLNENTKYTMKFRAKNRAGNSAWVTVTGKTLAKPIVEYIQKGPKCRTWRTPYKVLFQNGNVSYPAGGYMPQKDNVEVMHGEWIELRDKYESGVYVKKGTRWGNHKSVFFLDYTGWQNRLAGKEIIDVKFYIKRRNTQHGYPDDGRFLNIYTHNYSSTASMPSASKGPTIADHYRVDKLDFDRGQGLWVTLPKLYGEKLRDGKIKGIAFHHPSSTRTPYSYMRFDAQTFQFKIRYK